MPKMKSNSGAKKRFRKTGKGKYKFKRAYKNLPEYLKGFEFTVACLQDAESLERVAYEFAWDCWNENVFYTEVRFAPQLHAHPGFDVLAVLRAVREFARAHPSEQVEVLLRRARAVGAVDAGLVEVAPILADPP